jgi:hypothetical protein
VPIVPLVVGAAGFELPVDPAEDVDVEMQFAGHSHVITWFATPPPAVSRRFVR